MAFIFSGFEFAVRLVDNGGVATTRTYSLSAADEDEADIAILAILTALGGVTDSVISGYSLNRVTAQDTLTLPASGVQNENQALIIMQLTDVTKRATVSVPGAKPGIFMASAGAGADIVNPANAAVLAYVNLFDGDPATVSDGESSTGIISGHRRHVASRYH